MTQLDRLLAFTTAAEGHTPLRLGTWSENEVLWRPCAESAADMLRFLISDSPEEEVQFGLPQRKPVRPPLGVHETSVLWARIEGTKQLKWARWFKPLPSAVLQEGQSTRRLLLWALREPVGYLEAINLNRRLAYKFGAKQNVSDPDLLWINVPGTALRVGRKRPCPVSVSRLTPARYDAQVVAGRLREPPEPTWNKR